MEDSGAKFDLEKPALDLISPLALAYLGKVLTYGAKKYASNNWRKGIPETRLIAATMRHLVAYNAGQDDDLETGLPHMAHAMCECMFLLEQHFSSRSTPFDDRFKLARSQLKLLTAVLGTTSPELGS